MYWLALRCRWRNFGKNFNIMRKKNRKSLPRRVNKDFIQKIIFKSPA